MRVIKDGQEPVFQSLQALQKIGVPRYIVNPVSLDLEDDVKLDVVIAKTLAAKDAVRRALCSRTSITKLPLKALRRVSSS